MERTKYTVHKSNIKDDDGEKKGHGELVELGPKLARHYNDLGYLRPYIPDVDVDDDEGSTSNGSAQRAISAQKRASEETAAPRGNRTAQL